MGTPGGHEKMHEDYTVTATGDAGSLASENLEVLGRNVPVCEAGCRTEQPQCQIRIEN